MQFSYLVTFTHPDPDARISAGDLETMTTRIDATPNLRRARLYTPQRAEDYYTNDGPSPIFALQLDFDTLVVLEASIAADGHLQSIARSDFPSLAACAVEQQVMARRPFPLVTPTPRAPTAPLPCPVPAPHPAAPDTPAHCR